MNKNSALIYHQRVMIFCFVSAPLYGDGAWNALAICRRLVRHIEGVTLIKFSYKIGYDKTKYGNTYDMSKNKNLIYWPLLVQPD